MKQNKVFIFILVCMFMIAGLSPIQAKTANIASTQAYNRILFVVDVSNSMNYQDQDKLVHEIIKLFIDGTHSAKTDVGIITYNDEILTTYPLTPVSSLAQRESLKTEVDTMARRGSTDIGRALNYGMDMFRNDPVEGSRPVMVLISDGETDLTYTRTGRTMADSRADEKLAYEKAKSLDCPIYPIGISRSGNLNTAYLYEIANNTGGKAYDVQSSKSLYSVAEMIFSDITDTDISFSEPIRGVGSQQSIALDIPKQYTDETTLLLFNQAGLSAVWVDGDAENAAIHNSARYTSIKITPPSSERITVHFTAEAGDEIQIGIVNNFNIFPKVTTSGYTAGAQVDIEAVLFDLYSGEVVMDERMYTGLSAELFITDQEAGETMALPMVNAGNSFKAEYTNDFPGNGNLQVRVDGNNYSAQSDVSAVHFTNSPPDYLGGIETNLLKGKEVSYELKDHFNDPDGDILSFEIAGPSDYADIAAIEGTRLVINPQNLGDTTISIRASDGRGGMVLGFFTFEIQPFWIFYRNAIITIGCMIIALLAAYLFFKMKKPAETAINPAVPITSVGSPLKFNSARFEGYFLDTKSGNEIPVLNWNASFIENKHRVTLGELLSMMDVGETLPEANKIFFEAGSNNTVIFYHNTKCIINIGDKTIPDNKKVVLKFDAKIYIIFEDNMTELEVRYKRARKLVTA